MEACSIWVSGTTSGTNTRSLGRRYAQNDKESNGVWASEFKARKHTNAGSTG